MKGLKLSIVALVLLVWCAVAFARPIRDHWRLRKSAPSEAAMYEVGLLNGFMIMNVFLKTLDGKDQRLYCQPDKLTLNGDTIESMIDDYYKDLSPELKAQRFETDDFDGVPIFALMQTFPCKK